MTKNNKINNLPNKNGNGNGNYLIELKPNFAIPEI